jgi:hypothetical protein
MGIQRCLTSRFGEPLNPATSSGQWRAMPDGNDGIHGIPGNVVSAIYRF